MNNQLALIPSPSDFDPDVIDWPLPQVYQTAFPSLHTSSNKRGILGYEQMWHFTDGAFTHGLEMTRVGKLAEPTKLDPSVPIQAILCGWETIESGTRSHPAWIALRDIDEKVFGEWKSKPQKIAIMYVCSLVMQVGLRPSLMSKDESNKRVSIAQIPRPKISQEYHLGYVHGKPPSYLLFPSPPFPQFLSPTTHQPTN